MTASVGNVAPHGDARSSPLPWSNETYLRTLFATMPAVVIIIDRDGIYRYYSELNPPERIASKIGQSIFADRQNYPEFLTNIRLALAGEAVQATHTFQGQTAETRYAPLRDDAGAIIGAIYIAIEITDRTTAETARQKSESQLRAYYQAFPLPTYTWQHREGKFYYIDHNIAAETFTEGRTTSTLGMTADVLHSDFPETYAGLVQCFTERTTTQHEARVRGGDLLVTFVYVPPDLVVMYTEDVTERRRAEATLRQRASDFRALIEQIPAMIYRAPALGKGETMFINSQSTATLGYTPAEWIDDYNFWKSHIHPDDQKSAIAAFATGHATNQPVQIEYRFRRADGRYIWMRDDALPISDKTGRQQYWHGLLQDITERKRTDMLLADQAVILKMIAQEAPLVDTLNAIARSIELIGDDTLVSILTVEEDETTLVCVAAPNLPEPYVERTRRVPIGEGFGSCGTAVYRRVPRHRHRPALADLPRYRTREWTSFVLVDSHPQARGRSRGPRSPHPRHLRRLFAHPAPTDRRRLANPRTLGRSRRDRDRARPRGRGPAAKC